MTTIPLFDVDTTIPTPRRGGEPTIDATGTTRRLRALAYVGHGVNAVSVHTGINVTDLTNLIRATTTQVTRTHAAKVKAATHDLCWRITPADGFNAAIAAAARERGWVSIMAWDNPDDPNERAVTEAPYERTRTGNPRRVRDRVDPAVIARGLAGQPPSRIGRRDRVAAVAIMNRNCSARQIASRLGIPVRLVMRDRDFLKRAPDWLRAEECSDLASV